MNNKQHIIPLPTYTPENPVKWFTEAEKKLSEEFLVTEKIMFFSVLNVLEKNINFFPNNIKNKILFFKKTNEYHIGDYKKLKNEIILEELNVLEYMKIQINNDLIKYKLELKSLENLVADLKTKCSDESQLQKIPEMESFIKLYKKKISEFNIKLKKEEIRMEHCYKFFKNNNLKTKNFENINENIKNSVVKFIHDGMNTLKTTFDSALLVSSSISSNVISNKLEKKLPDKKVITNVHTKKKNILSNLTLPSFSDKNNIFYSNNCLQIYISPSKLLPFVVDSNNFLSKNKNLNCFNYNEFVTKFDSFNVFDDELLKKKFCAHLHIWTITHANFLTENDEPTIFYSNPFPQNCTLIQFSLRMVTNFEKNYLSLYLHLEKLKKDFLQKPIKILFNFKINHVCQTKTDTNWFIQNDCYGFKNIYKLQNLKNLVDNTVVIMCNIYLDKKYDDCFKEKISESKIKAKKFSCRFSTEIVIKKFVNSFFAVDNPIIESEQFTLPNYEDNKFSIVLLKEKDNEHKDTGYISLCLKCSSSILKTNIFLTWRISILSWNKKPFVTGEGFCVINSKNVAVGAKKFILKKDLFNQNNDLLPNNNLTLYVEIIF